MDNLQLAQVIQEGFRDVKKDLDEIKNRLTVLEKHSIQDIYTMVKAHPIKTPETLKAI